MLSHWDPILKERVLKVEELQNEDERLHVHYLSNESKNEFFAECSDLLSCAFFGVVWRHSGQYIWFADH